VLDEIPATPAGTRGRPTQVLAPHPRGPVVLAIGIRRGGWQGAYAGLDGEPQRLSGHSDAGYRGGNQPGQVISEVKAAMTRARRDFAERLAAVSLSVAGTVQHGRVVHSATLGWEDIDLGGALALPAGGLPTLIGNDATLAGIAEARHGAASAARTSLHLSVLVGIGGTVVIDGMPVTGATGAGGEFGHLPFGDPALPCPCGAHGCWDVTVDGRALARLLGDPAPADPYGYAATVIAAAADDHDHRARTAVAHVAASLGRGVAGLVNAHDPEIVTLGGLGPAIVAAARGSFDGSYRNGLMGFRRDAPPPVVTAAHREDGPLRGAIDLALDLVLSESGLTAWSEKQQPLAWR
jgi:predicted NBD/HSP70 family sugar kinase